MATGVVLNGDLTLGTVGKADSEVAAEGVARGGRVEAHVHAVALAVGEHSAPTGAGQLDEARVLTADDDRAILTHEAHERAEGLLDLLQGVVVVHMVGLDVGHDDHVRVEVEEGAVRLIGLDDEVLAVAVLAVGAVTLHDTADQKARVELHAVEHGGDHGGRGRLAVGAGARDGRAAVAERGEHLGTVPHGNAELAGAHELGVGLGDRGRDDHDVGLELIDGRSGVTDMDRNARAGELADVAGGLKVGTGNPAAALMQNERDAAHAGSADANEVGALEGRGGGRLRDSDGAHGSSSSFRTHKLIKYTPSPAHPQTDAHGHNPFADESR